jgi:hypothetical protein
MIPVILRNDAVTGKKIPAIIYKDKQYNDIEIHFKTGDMLSVRYSLDLLRSESELSSIPKNYDIVKLDDSSGVNGWLVFEFYIQYGKGLRAGVEQAISSLSFRMSDIDRIEPMGQNLANDYRI